MFFWFAALSVLIVMSVFDSPAMDYRWVMLGSVLPVIEVAVGRPFVLHSLAGSVGAFVIVAVIARGRRVLGRQLVGIPIGLFLHLVLDGTWTQAKLFWWPFGGIGSLGARSVPERSHLGVTLVLEAVGVVVTMVMVSRLGLADGRRRAAFFRSGRLSAVAR